MSVLPMFLLCALSLSIGWGIRGNFGHEFGAMIAGALAAMAAVITSGRPDWWRRVAYFAVFGAIGWSFGGSMSYMQVVGYTHSGHSATQLYGFACLFAIGFLWAAPGGAGTALPAFLDRDRLTELFGPMSAVFATWFLQGVFLEPWFRHTLRPRGYTLNWYDADWLGALLAIAALLLYCLARRTIDRASALLLSMAVGWWVGFGVLVLGLGLRMTPPRGDNWAGCVGLTAGLLLYCWRSGLVPVAWCSLTTGLVGGIGFAAAQLLKLAEIRTGIETNWHSVMEQTDGLFHGLAIAASMSLAALKAPRVSDQPPLRRWTEPYAVSFVLLAITYLNLRKNPAEWVKVKAMPAVMYGLPAQAWFEIIYALLAAAVIWLLIRHLRKPLALFPEGWLGRAQWLYLVFLWWMVVGNFERALVAFRAQRLVTEGVLFVNGVACTLLALLLAQPARPAFSAEPKQRFDGALFARTLRIGLAVAIVAALAEWAGARALFGDQHAPGAGVNIRFGPNATTHTR